MRRALTFLVVAVCTAAASSAWLYDGDLAAAVAPVVPFTAEWNADALAAKEGIVPAAVPVPTAVPTVPAPAEGAPD